VSLGILGKKIGMTQVFQKDGTVVPVSVIHAEPNVVIQVKTDEVDGYKAVQVGFSEAKKLTKPQAGHQKKLGSFRYLREFTLDDIEGIEIGQIIDVAQFAPGERVDVTGSSKGKGTSGTIKRFHFRQGPKTHGSDQHRAPGSVGSGTTPGRVYKGMKMAGRLGDERVTVKDLEVVLADSDRNLLLIKGAIPGAKNGLVMVKKTVVGKVVLKAPESTQRPKKKGPKVKAEEPETEEIIAEEAAEAEEVKAEEAREVIPEEATEVEEAEAPGEEAPEVPTEAPEPTSEAKKEPSKDEDQEGA